MKKCFWAKAVAAGALALSASGAWSQTVLYTTLPAPGYGGPCFGGGRLAAVEVLTPAGAPYQINSATVRMHHADDTAASFSLGVYTDNAGAPGTLVAAIGTAAGNGLGTFDQYSLTPAAPIALAPATNYWVVASSASADDCAFGWTSGASAPSGLFSYVTEAQFLPPAWVGRPDARQALQLDGATATPAAVAAVPTLSEWAMLLMLSSVLVVGMRRLRG